MIQYITQFFTEILQQRPFKKISDITVGNFLQEVTDTKF